MTQTSEYKHIIGKIKKLIDLNGDSTNFESSFQISSENKTPFEIAVVDSDTLDNNDNLEYKKVVNGIITGKVVQNKNIYKSYSLILRADKECNCQIRIDKKELPLSPEATNPPEKVENYIPLYKKKTENFSWKKILLILGIICLFALFLYWYSKKEVENFPEVEPRKTPSPIVFDYPTTSPVKNLPSNYNLPMNNSKVNFSERLKRLEL
jgi:hypothetical protein